jgi:threonyl-tRNA synthetase
LHRVILGSIERFVGVLIEHFAGAFPVWLSPVQAIVLTVTDRAAEFAQTVGQRLRAEDVRVELDLRNEKLGYKIREAQLQKIPYILVIGDKEVEQGGVAPRLRSGDDLGFMTLDDFVARIKPEIGPPRLT